MSARSIAPEAFFERPVRVVARELLGCLLVRDRGTPDQVVLRITEVEAYGGPEDTASHCRSGRTARNAAMWGPPGRAYVYLCYGLHQMLNLVTGAEGEGQAVLIRSCEVVSGDAIVRARRAEREGPGAVAGPGNVGSAIALDRSFTGRSICEPGPLEVHRGSPVSGIAIGRRIGVDYASEADRAAELRFAIAGSLAVTHRRALHAPG